MSDIKTLRETLFDVLAGLKDKTIDIEQAKAINETAQTIINTAKAETDYARATGRQVISSFIPDTGRTEVAPTAPAQLTVKTAYGTKETKAVPGGEITTHRLR